MADDVVRVGGTGSALGILRSVAAAFQETHPGLAIHIAPSLGSSGAIKAVAQKALDVGLISRGLTAEERRLDLRAEEFARSPFILVAGKDVPISGLSLDEVAQIYRGGTRTWASGERIRLVLRPAADADTKLARTLSPGMGLAIDMASAREGMLVALTNQEALDFVEKLAGSLCFSSLAQVKAESRGVKILSLNGVQPDLKTLADGTYPWHLTFSMVTATEQTPKVRAFIEFLRSPAGHAILVKNGSQPVPFR